MDNADVVVVGAGLAGLQCARLVARAGLSVILVDRKSSPDQFIHTTGIFVRRTFEDFRFPEGTLGEGIRRVTVHSPSGREVSFDSSRDEFRIGRMRALYSAMLLDALAAGVRFRGDTSFVRLDFGCDRVIARFLRHKAQERIAARIVVAADGASSRVATGLGLAAPGKYLTGVEEVFVRRRGATDRRLRCFLDPDIAPGYIGWIADDGAEVHVGAAGEIATFNATAALARMRGLASQHIDMSALEQQESRGGRIPAGGILPEIATTRGLLVGDAAGAVSPLTAGGLDAAIRLSAFAAQSIVTSIRSGTRLDQIYSGERFRARFLKRLWMRHLFAQLGPVAMEAAVALLASTPLHRLGERIFFGHGSFPIPLDDLAEPFRSISAAAA